MGSSLFRGYWSIDGRAGAAVAIGALVLSGCSAGGYRREADHVAYSIIEQKQKEALGRTEPFTVETPEVTLRKKLLVAQGLPVTTAASYGSEHLPRIEHLPTSVNVGVPVPSEETSPEAPPPLKLTLLQSLEVGAHNSREYQAQKERVFVSALDLDLERDQFRLTFTGLLSGEVVSDQAAGETGVIVTPNVGVSKRFYNGALLTAHLAVDLVKLLGGGSAASLGIAADASVAFPLLRGAGKHIVTEPLTQAERDALYSVWDFETFKKTFAVSIATQYLTVLQALDQVKNAEENYRSLISSSRRARRLAEAGRLDQVQVDQSVQQELSARERWISAMETLERRLDTFKILLGLPTDARVELDRAELTRLEAIHERVKPEHPAPPEENVPADAPIELAAPGLGRPGDLEIGEDRAVRIALENRLDLRVASGDVFDAERKVMVAADALRAGLTLSGTASYGGRRSSLGSAVLPDAELRIDEGRYTATALLDLPLERTAERNRYRETLIALESVTRSLQALEDTVKLQVRTRISELLQSRESLLTQAEALALAQRRVASTTLFLEAGRVQIRDLLDAQNDLISAQNAFSAALISYRVAELGLQRDLGVLEVSEDGLWTEYRPEVAP